MKSSCSKELVKPHKNVQTANQRMVNCSTFTRPILSARMPASHPPTADVIRVAVAMRPACALLMPQAVIRVGITNV